MMDLRTIPIENILPQRRPFIMVDCLTEYSGSGAATELYITDDNILVDNGMLSYSGLIENMAQTCAAIIGYYSRYVLGEDVSIGVIGAVRDVRIYSLPEVGQTIHTGIEIVTEVFNVRMVKARIAGASGNLLAEGTLKIALTDSKAVREEHRNGMPDIPADSSKG